jgi:uncharacterized phage protein (TIGR02216 family)
MTAERAAEPRPFPWEDAMMLGLGVLRWSSDQFWRATPRELVAAWNGLQGGRRIEPAMSRDLRQMMQAFRFAQILNESQFKAVGLKISAGMEALVPSAS